MPLRILLIGIIILSSFLFNSGLSAKSYVYGDDIGQLWERYRNAGPDSSKLTILKKISSYYQLVDGNASLSENISQIAISLSKSTKDEKLILIALNNYLEVVDLAEFKDQASEVAFEAKKINC